MSGSRRLLLSGIALLTLLALVAVASRAHRAGGGSGAAPQHPPTLAIEYFTSAMLVLLPFGALFCVWALFVRRREQLKSGQNNWRRTVALIAISMAFLAGALFAGGHGLFPDGHKLLTHLRGSTPPVTHKGPKTDSPQSSVYSPRFRLVPVVVLGSLALLFLASAGWVYLRKWRGSGALAQEAALAAALDEVLADSLDDLRGERDPRQAVIRTYARMEQTFAAYGVPREESETPQEYVERVLDQLRVSAYSVRRLAQLYGRAKFSVHEIDGRMKDDAIEALAGLRAELEHMPSPTAGGPPGRREVAL